MTTAIHRGDALLARTTSHRRKVARAISVITDAVAQARAQGGTPYVAFSGGKDSTVVLALAADVSPGITAIWTDDELEHDEQVTYIPRLCANLGVTLRIKTGTQIHAGWFRSWSDDPFWRQPLPSTIVTQESVRILAPQWGYPVTILGLRKGENGYRKRYLDAKGRLHPVADGTWRCNPLAEWTVDDVWAYIADRGLPYNPVYDVLERIGVPRDQQRVGPLPLSDGWVLRAGWPEMYERLIARYGCQWG